MLSHFRRVSRQMIHVSEVMLREKMIDEAAIEDRAFNKNRAFGDVVEEPAAQIVQNDDFVTFALHVPTTSRKNDSVNRG